MSVYACQWSIQTIRQTRTIVAKCIDTIGTDNRYYPYLCTGSPPPPRYPPPATSAAASTRPSPHWRRTPARLTGRRGQGGRHGPPSNGRPALPAAPADVADYLEARHAGGASPATVRTARAAVAKVHQVSGLGDPTADGLCKDVLRRIGREGRDRGRGQVAGIGWAHAEAAASLASNGSDSLQGLRDAAIVRVMSDTLARISEVAALRCADVEADASGGGTLLIRASKSDQQGEGSTRYVGPATLAAVNRYLEAAGHAAGPLFRQVRRGGHASDDPLGADSIRAIVRRRAAAVDGIAGRIGGHSLRVGSARELAADGASVAELQQAGGWKSPTTPGVYIRREAAARGPVARRRYKVGA